MRRLLACIALVAMAGCIGPPAVPQDALQDADEGLPGLSLYTWTQMHGDRLRMHALLSNDGGTSYDIRYGCGQPWNSTIVAPDGSAVPYRQVLEEPNCPVLWDVLRPKAHLDTLYSWDFQAHDVEHDRHEPVPPGNYTWVLQVGFRDRPEVLESRIPILVG